MSARSQAGITRRLFSFLACAVMPLAASAAGDPFEATAAINTNATPAVLSVTFKVLPNHYLYADEIRVERTDKGSLSPLDIPAGHRKHDSFLGTDVVIYDRDTKLTYNLDPKSGPLQSLEISYQGCSTSICYRPVTRKVFLAASPVLPVVDTPPPPEIAADWRLSANRFTMAGHATGYLPPKDFIALLDTVESGLPHAPDPLRGAYARGGILLLVLVVLLGGLALNLTPCVLPMIPVNLAIIGAGVHGGSRLRGFGLGTTYGLGIAVAYGILGVFTVLTGARFGSLNASPLFNLSVAGIFLLMALAMFNVFVVDFSRFQGSAGTRATGRGRYLTAFFFGAIAALLAGACVAPILISVLLFSTDFYGRGHGIALVLPFILGIGMALPWPLAGAGFALLPKPGRWMEKVKHVFGVIVLAFALLYISYGVRGLRPAATGAGKTGHLEWMTSLDSALRTAEQEGKPVFIDFWASWCKNCVQMDRTTFVDPAVAKRLEQYVRLRYQAEDFKDPEVDAVLNRYEVIGLPTYVILKPPANGAPHHE